MGNNSLNSTFNKKQKNLNETRTFTQQIIQTTSLFIYEEIVETLPKTTLQSISPIHPTLTTPHNKKTPFPQTTIQSTVKPSIAPKYSQLD